MQNFKTLLHKTNTFFFFSIFFSKSPFYYVTVFRDNACYCFPIFFLLFTRLCSPFCSVQAFSERYFSKYMTRLLKLFTSSNNAYGVLSIPHCRETAKINYLNFFKSSFFPQAITEAYDVSENSKKIRVKIPPTMSHAVR